MKKLLFAVAIPLLAGCFAWDTNEKPWPWSPDPEPPEPSIGTVVTYPENFQPAPMPGQVELEVVSVDAGHAVYPSEQFIQVQEDPDVESADLPVPADTKASAPPAPAAKDDGMEKRIEALEKRIEDLYQIILKSYGK